MDVSCKLTVYFEAPFWVGVYERYSETRLETAKIVFGAEPKDYMVYAFLLNDWSKLSFGTMNLDNSVAEKKINPKRLQRHISKNMSSEGIGTKAQQALKLQHEQHKKEKLVSNREKTEAENRRKFELKQQKKKEKHKGR